MQCFKYSSIFVFILSFLLLIPQTVYAYLDPGTGSYIVQVIIVSFFGAGFAIKLYFKRIKQFFTERILKKNSNNE